MLANRTSDLEDWLKKQEELGPDDDFGDDWESAFQMEDTCLAAGEGAERESLTLPLSPSNLYQFSPLGEADSAHPPDLDQEMEKATLSRHQVLPMPADHEKTAGTRNSIWQSFKKSIAARPLIHRLALGGSILGSLTVLAIFFLGSPAPQQLVQLLKQETGLSSKSSPSAPTVAIGQNENIRRKWDFKPFFLPVTAADSGEKLLFLEVDLTLMLVLAPDEEIPHAKKILIRELIYQYFRQQPLPILRHYALARGEMNRNLLAWLREQWPEASVETVIFKRYQLS
jgi:hypothetical protein